MPAPAESAATPRIRFGGFLDPSQVIGDYAAAASFLVGGDVVLVTVSVTLAAIMAGRAGHPIDWLDYPPLAALGYERIADLTAQEQTASEIPLTGDDAEAMLRVDHVWWEGERA